MEYIIWILVLTKNVNLLKYQFATHHKDLPYMLIENEPVVSSNGKEVLTSLIIFHMLRLQSFGIPFQTRTTRTPAFWGYPPLPHDYLHYWIMLGPKSKQGRMTLKI